MKFKRILIFITLCYTAFCFAQSERSRKFKINAGFEYRIVPYFFKSPEGAYLSYSMYSSNVSKHLSGNSVNVDIEYFFLKNTSIGIAQGFRYDELYSDLKPPSYNDPQFYATDTHMRFISETEIQLKHYFPLNFDQQALIAVAGYGFMNNNTLFRVSQVVIADNGDLLYTRTGEVDFQYQSYKLGIGYKYKNLEITAGTYLVEKHNFEGLEHTGFGMPFLKLSYNIITF